MTIFYCLKFDTPPTLRVRSPYLYPPGTGWPSYAPRHWVPFSSPYDSQGYGGGIRPRLHTGIRENRQKGVRAAADWRESTKCNTQKTEETAIAWQRLYIFSIGKHLKIFFILLTLFKKIKVRLWDHLALCLYLFCPAFAKQRLSKHFPAATNTHNKLEKILDTSISMRWTSCQRKVKDLFFPELVFCYANIVCMEMTLMHNIREPLSFKIIYFIWYRNYFLNKYFHFFVIIQNVKSCPWRGMLLHSMGLLHHRLTAMPMHRYILLYSFDLRKQVYCNYSYHILKW
jgi:hypothetical protein